VKIALVVAASLFAIAVAALAVAIIRGGAAIRRFEREVVAITTAAGYAPFGPLEGRWLCFRSATSYLRVVRGGHGTYVDALLAARGAASPADDNWVDDDLLRQVLLGEQGDPTGQKRVWSDNDAFLRFLREHLSRLDAAIASTDPAIHSAIAAARIERAERRRRCSEQVEAERKRRG